VGRIRKERIKRELKPIKKPPIWMPEPIGYPVEKMRKPSKIVRAMKTILKIMGGVVLSFFSLALLIFGILLIGTKIGWFSLPWIEDLWFTPIGFFIVLAGIGAVAVVVSITSREGCISLLIAGIAIYLTVVTAFPNASKILLWRGEDGEFMEEYVRSDSYLPFVMEGRYVVGGDGHRIWLHNNPNAKNPSFYELLMFLEQDKTEQRPYSWNFVCTDFAEMLHNNAEKAGIRCAYVLVEFSDRPGGHALNAFKTVDKGLVFVDDTAPLYGINCDSIVVLEIGKPYVRIPLFSDVEYEPMGIVKSYRIQW